ncbi:MAG: hypothetical protein WA125_18115, partial [Desulfosporosinus sp.]
MASGVRFLQCGGCCFDSPSWEGPEGWAAQRNQDLWRTFEAVLSLCRTEKIMFLFLTGDLSNRKTPTSTSGRGTPYSASVGVDSDFAAKNSFWDVRLRRN